VRQDSGQDKVSAQVTAPQRENKLPQKASSKERTRKESLRP